MILAGDPAFERVRAVLQNDPSASELLLRCRGQLRQDHGSCQLPANGDVGGVPTSVRRDNSYCLHSLYICHNIHYANCMGDVHLRENGPYRPLTVPGSSRIHQADIWTDDSGAARKLRIRRALGSRQRVAERSTRRSATSHAAAWSCHYGAQTALTVLSIFDLSM